MIAHLAPCYNGTGHPAPTETEIVHEDLNDYRVAIAFALIKGTAVGVVLCGVFLVTFRSWFKDNN